MRPVSPRPRHLAFHVLHFHAEERCEINVVLFLVRTHQSNDCLGMRELFLSLEASMCSLASAVSGCDQPFS